jgi:hypothetical protein
MDLGRDGMMLELLPEGERTRKKCLVAVKENGYALQFVPAGFKQELSMTAVTSNGNALQYVPNKTQEICLAAVKQNRLALEYVPANIRERIGNTNTGIVSKLLRKTKGFFGFGRRSRKRR